MLQDLGGCSTVVLEATRPLLAKHCSALLAKDEQLHKLLFSIVTLRHEGTVFVTGQIPSSDENGLQDMVRQSCFEAGLDCPSSLLLASWG